MKKIRGNNRSFSDPATKSPPYCHLDLTAVNLVILTPARKAPLTNFKLAPIWLGVVVIPTPVRKDLPIHHIMNAAFADEIVPLPT